MHILYRWAHELVTHPRILDAVEDVLGPNILCWTTNFFIKEARDPAFVSFHQDATYWGLDPPDVMTAWVALSDCPASSGPMLFAPGTHRTQLAHRDTFHQDNLLTRGQEIAVDVDRRDAVAAILKPGEVSLHHVMVVHGSLPNESDDRRIGLAIRYIPTHVRQLKLQDAALLVRGRDDYGHFGPERVPQVDAGPAERAAHQAAMDRQVAVLYAGTDKKTMRD